MKSILNLIVFILISYVVFASGTPGTDVPGKMIFSDQPFNGAATGKTSFVSKDHIYGRIELSGSNIKDAFKVKDGKYPYLCFGFYIFQKDEQLHEDWHNYFYVKANELSGNALNFDIMPDPSKATTVFSMTDDFSAGYGFTPFNNLLVNYPVDEGEYRIKIKIFNMTQDGWGREQDMDKWPAIEGEYTWKFSDADIQQVKNDLQNVRTNTLENAFRYDKLPDVFSNGATINDPLASNAKILAIIKRDLPERTILKMAIEKTSGVLWHIAKDEFDFPKYRYFNPSVFVAYKLDGKCRVGDITLRQVYSGGGTWGPLQVAFTSASGQPDRGIDCVKIK